ncbi:MAG: histidine kinase [Lachnospiraceae bacterium]|nr:histidine kinase [Lachnospiraceae bacterium]
MKKKLRGLRKKAIIFWRKNMLPEKRWTIQFTTALSFTVVAACLIAMLSVSLYRQFIGRMERMQAESAQQLLGQTVINLEDYLRSMRRISDAMYYSAIKDHDIDKTDINKDMSLLYEANKDNLVSIACYTRDGELLAASPVATQKENVDVTSQEWFTSALEKMENLHFSMPHVQNLFNDTNYRYNWVISLSSAIELTRKGSPEIGILLVDMNYSSIEQIMSKVNNNSKSYVYMIDSSGDIIYHPKQRLLVSGFFKENNNNARGYTDGIHVENFEGEQRMVIVKSVSYTGWKLISVTPTDSLTMGIRGMKYYMILLMSLGLLAIIILNQFVSYRIALPIKKLNESVKKWEAGDRHPNIYIGGTSEVEHLGRTLASTLSQIRVLMNDIVVEQEEKRKSELDALQSQINPHFLYNTLESIVWMIEGERYKDAVYMVTELSSLFRISLSKGKTIISIADEIKHAKNYMNIQKIRYKNSFSIDFDIDDEILDCCTVKLIIQPLLENAIYYGVEGMDGDGEIWVKGYRKDDDIYIEVSDNGIGIPEENLKELLVDDNHVRKHGSGVGMINVHKRIKLRFGEEYGMELESELDEGTTVRIHLPYIPYNPENQQRLEKGERKV